MANEFVNFDIRIYACDESRHLVTAELVADRRGDILPGEVSDVTSQDMNLDDYFEGLDHFVRALIARESDAEELGQKILDFIFPRPVKALFDSGVAAVDALDKEGLRVRLRIDNDAHKLSMIPWEYCWGDGIPMALDKKTPFIRYVHSSKAPTRITRVEVVKILVVMASPEDDELDPVSVEDEARWIEEALADLVVDERIELEVVADINRRELFRTVSRFDPHIFHFLGHGAIGEEGKGELYLTASNGQPEPLDEQQLKALLQSSNTGLAILSACQSGLTLEDIDARDGEMENGGGRQNTGAMGLAPALVGAGIPAVIAMQSKVPQDTAITFVRDLYENLIDDRPLDVAMTQARIGAYLDDKRFWAIPTLFMRSPDGLIWKPRE